MSTGAGERSTSKLTHGCWQDSGPCRLSEGLSSSLGIGQKPPSIPCHVGLSTGWLSACQFALSKRERERGRERVFHSLVPSEEVTSYHFGPILCIRRKSLGPAHTQREESHKGVDTRRPGSLGAISEAECGRQCNSRGSNGLIILGPTPVVRGNHRDVSLLTGRSLHKSLSQLEQRKDWKGSNE